MRNITAKAFVNVPMDCHKPIVEQVRLWEDEGFIIIWSCVNDTIGVEHDEAVMLIEVGSDFYGQFKKNRRTSQRILDRLNVTVRKYLQEPLLNQIDWTLYEYEEDPDYNYPWSSPLKCPLLYQNIIIYMVSGAVFLVLVVTFLIFLNFKN